MKDRTRAVSALLAGATLALGAPPLRVWPATFVAMALFGISVDGARPGRAAFHGWIMGTVATLGAFYWIVGTVHRYTSLPLGVAITLFVLMSALAGVTLGLAGFVSSIGAPRMGTPLALALGIVIAERYAPSVFPWQIAAPLIFAPWIPQAADVLGVSVLGATLTGVMTVIARSIPAVRASAERDNAPTSSKRALSIALGVFALLWAYGAIRTVSVRDAIERAPTLRVALVQPAIAPAARWDELSADVILLNLHEQTRQALAHGADLVVWSEAAFPFQLPHAAGIDGVVAPPIYPVPAAVPLLVGAVTETEDGHRYNSALIREPDGGLSAPVDKRQLVPFGEYLPVVGGIEWVRRTFARAQGLTPGDRPTILHTGSGRTIGVLNCFEDTMAHRGAELSRAEILVNITNDAWFGQGAEPWAHLMLAAWRSIETRRDLLRAVNTGVTCRVDALGHVTDAAPLGRPAVLYAQARRMSLRTLAPLVIVYAPPAAIAGALAAFVADVLARRRRNRTAA